MFALILVLIAALAFEYINGFHDAANSIATVVSTRVLSPGIAVLWAAFFNFVAFAVFGTRVAKAIGDGVRMDLILPEQRLWVLLAALLGAIIWNLKRGISAYPLRVPTHCSEVMPAPALRHTEELSAFLSLKFGLEHSNSSCYRR